MKTLRYLILLLVFFSGVSISEEVTTDDVVKLSPKIREEKNAASKYIIDVEELSAYLNNIVVFDDVEQFENLPFIYKFLEDSIIGGPETKCFVKGLQQLDSRYYTILREKTEYIDRETKENLGFEFNVVGLAKIIEKGTDITKIEVVQAQYPIEKGDKLFPRVSLELPAVIKSKYSKKNLQGKILNVEEGMWYIGKYQNIIINLGERDGVEQGDLFNVLRLSARTDLLPSKQEPDKKRSVIGAEKEEFAFTNYGEIMVYKVFNKLSLAIVLKAEFPITIFDVVKSEEESS